MAERGGEGGWGWEEGSGEWGWVDGGKGGG